MDFDHTLLARILLTIATVGYGFVPILADFNATHATNPRWVPHARFHVVWQVCSFTAIALLALALALIWGPGPNATQRLYLAALLAACAYAGFFAALAGMRFYGGGTYDENGYLPFKAPLGIGRNWDVNVTAFSAMVAMLIAGTASI